MPIEPDNALLAKFVQIHDQQAFSALVKRHVDWVYSAALRRAGDPATAEDVTQATFLMLSKKAAVLQSRPNLAPWLFSVMSFSVRAALRREQVRKKHESRAMEAKMQNDAAKNCWSEIETQLESAVERLSGPDREAILLRFYQRLSFPEMATALGVGEDAARKRVERAVEKLRDRLQPQITDAGTMSSAMLAFAALAAPSHLHIAAAVQTPAVISIYQGAKTMMLTAKLKIAAAIIAVALLPAAVGGLILTAHAETSATFSASDLELSKETTIITSPLHPNGTPDYIAAVNAKYSAGVTPQNNAFTGWAELNSGDKFLLSTKSKDEILRMAGVENVPGIPYVAYIEFLKSQSLTAEAADKQGSEEIFASERLWTDADFPLVARWLSTNEKHLDAMPQVWGREKYWQPWVASDGRSMFTVLLPSLGRARDTAYATLCRATYRANKGDFPGFLTDVTTALRMAHHFQNAPTLIECLFGISIEKCADESIGAVAGTGRLTAAQCAQLTQLLQSFPATSITESLDISERWNMLDSALLIRSGNYDIDNYLTDNIPFSAIDRTAVDWNAALQLSNQTVDGEIAALKQPSLDEMLTAYGIIRRRFPNYSKNEAVDVAKGANETSADYSQRIGTILIRSLLPDVSRAETRHRENVLRKEMILALLAAARYRADKNNWPQQLSDLTPAYLPAIPEDIYLPGQSVLYRKDDAGVTLYSVGPNRIDDNGSNQKGLRDDIAIGVFRPAKIQFDTTAPAGYLSSEDRDLDGFPSIIR